MNTTHATRALGRLGLDELPAGARHYGVHETWTEVAPGLWVGGTADSDTIRHAQLSSPLAGLAPGEVTMELERTRYYRGTVTKRDFDAVCTLYAQALPAGNGVAELRFSFNDDALDGDEWLELLDTARWVARRWAAGQRVLVRCQAGLNRSSFIASLAMILNGAQPAEAIALIRRRRSNQCLFNEHFVAALLEQKAGSLR